MVFCRQDYSLQKKIREHIRRKALKENDMISVNTVFADTTVAGDDGDDLISHDDMNYGEDSTVDIKCESIISWRNGEDVLQGFRRHLNTCKT